MLTLTNQAVAAIRDLTNRPGLPEQTGLRIEPQNANGASGLALTLSDGPQVGDEVIEEADVHVFLQHDAAPVLADMALDAQVNENGEVSFLLQQRA